MAKHSKGKKVVAVDDEPGAENRFMRGIRKALKTPHKPHKDEPKRRTKGSKQTKEDRDGR